MKRTALIAICVSMLGVAAGSSAETPPDAQQTQQLAKLVKDLQEQQAAMADNQAKIEAKLAAVTEAVRQARIYASRGGRP